MKLLGCPPITAAPAKLGGSEDQCLHRVTTVPPPAAVSMKTDWGGLIRNAAGHVLVHLPPQRAH